MLGGRGRGVLDAHIMNRQHQGLGNIPLSYVKSWYLCFYGG